MSRTSRKLSNQPIIVADRSSQTLVAGVICLLLGLVIGYYFGKSGASQSLLQNQAAGGEPSAFLREASRLRSALLLNPRDVDALVQLGNLHYDQGQFSDAIEYYGRALEIDPKNPNVRTDRGTSYWNLGQAEAAIGEFNKSLEIDPNHAQTLYNLGLVYLNGKSDHEQARRAWERLLESNPNYPERAKVERQLTSLRSAASISADDKQGPEPKIEDLLNRIKKY